MTNSSKELEKCFNNKQINKGHELSNRLDKFKEEHDNKLDRFNYFQFKKSDIIKEEQKNKNKGLSNKEDKSNNNREGSNNNNIEKLKKKGEDKDKCNNGKDKGEDKIKKDKGNKDSKHLKDMKYKNNNKEDKKI